MAAEAYARITGTPGVLNVTTGPGAINALNGVFGAWTDSIPMLIVSGQVKRETVRLLPALPHCGKLGDQEVDIINMVRGITTYSVLVDDPESIRYHLAKSMVSGKSWKTRAMLAGYSCRRTGSTNNRVQFEPIRPCDG